MAAQKTTDRGTVYTVADAHGNAATVKQGQSSFVGAAPTIAITVGGNTVSLTKQNFIDLLPIFTTFSTTGVLS